jgi:chitinase
MSQRPTTLTYSRNEERNGERRGQQCPSGFCAEASKTLERDTGRNQSLQCDEAPWASSEEGGNFYPDKISRSQTCVPSYQNTGWAGSTCQSKLCKDPEHRQWPTDSFRAEMVRDLQTNWGQLDPELPKDQRVDNWVPWIENGMHISFFC